MGRMEHPRKSPVARLASGQAARAGAAGPTPASPRHAGRDRRSDGLPMVIACIGCGVTFRRKRRRARYHSPECAAVASRNLAGAGPLDCKRCGQSFSARQPNATFCSRLCYAMWHNTRNAGLTRKRHALSARLRIAILDRDNWICYLCGVAIAQSRKRPHPLSPTVDHVVPIAMNGSHDPSNLAAAHLRCNIEKGDNEPHWWQRPPAVRRTGGLSFG